MHRVDNNNTLPSNTKSLETDRQGSSKPTLVAASKPSTDGAAPPPVALNPKLLGVGRNEPRGDGLDPSCLKKVDPPIPGAKLLRCERLSEHDRIRITEYFPAALWLTSVFSGDGDGKRLHDSTRFYSKDGRHLGGRERTTTVFGSQTVWKNSEDTLLGRDNTRTAHQRIEASIQRKIFRTFGLKTNSKIVGELMQAGSSTQVQTRYYPYAIGSEPVLMSTTISSTPPGSDQTSTQRIWSLIQEGAAIEVLREKLGAQTDAER